jgi:hypothetical protein
VTARCLFVCSWLLLFVNVVYAGGVYQRTRDGKTLVWNNYPRRGDEATWSGKRDADGYAVGPGTLTWFGVISATPTGSNIPSKSRPILFGRYSGNMVRGKFDGPVVNVDANGKTFHLTFINGRRAGQPGATPAPAISQQPNQRVDRKQAVQAPAEGPSPSPEQKSDKRPSGGVIVEAPTQEGTPPEQANTPRPSPMAVAALASPRPTVPPPPPNDAEVDPAIKDRVAELKEQTESVLSQVGDATGNFQEIERLDSVQRLPAPVSENVGSLSDRTRDLRAKLGPEKTLRECRTETETVDALATIDQVTRAIATDDAPEASSKVADFLKNNPEPSTESQKSLWGYLASIQSLCSRLEKQAEIHLQRAQSFAAASKTSEAIQEYQEAYRIFPNPATAEKIRQLQDNSLGL